MPRPPAPAQILEECGYNVPVGSIHEVTSFITAIGISGARQTIFAAEVGAGQCTELQSCVLAASRGKLSSPGACSCVSASDLDCRIAGCS